MQRGGRSGVAARRRRREFPLLRRRIRRRPALRRGRKRRRRRSHDAAAAGETRRSIRRRWTIHGAVFLGVEGNGHGAVDRRGDGGFRLFRDEFRRRLSHVRHNERRHRRMTPAFEMKLSFDVVRARESLHGFVDFEVEAMAGGEDGKHETARVGDTVTDEELEDRR